jgi:hypothetical protein
MTDDEVVVALHEAACLQAHLGRRDPLQQDVGEAAHFSPAVIRVIS